MRTGQITNIIKPEWFGKNISVLLTNEETFEGELTEVGEKYLVIKTAEGELQVMVHAIVTIRLGEAG